MSADSPSLDTRFDEFEGVLRKPPVFLLYLGLVSIAIGLATGLIGLLSASGATNLRQYSLGLTGYFLSEIGRAHV